jgi:methyl-accepting chemotaxis protein
MEEQSAGSQQILEAISKLNELTGMVKTSLKRCARIAQRLYARVIILKI